MQRRFNVAGICFPDRHYMLSPLSRLPRLRDLINEQSYLVLHAPRQSGKSTTLSALGQALTAEGRFASLLLSVEPGVPFREDVGAAELPILQHWRDAAEDRLPAELLPPPWPEAPAGSRIAHALRAWSRACPRPLVIFVDEIDALSGEPLISILRQLRTGYSYRPTGFPWSLGLCGMRDVRDYKLAAGGSERLHTSSPFNIKIESLTLTNFTPAEVTALLGQHTDDTGQPFLPEALALVAELSGGQPWLVNALARQLVEVLVPERSKPITADHVQAARELLILRRDTHLDSLAERLRDPRVRRVIEPILTGQTLPMDMMNDDLVYVRDLGLIAPDAPVRIANPIYREVIPRSLTFVVQEYLQQETAWYKKDDGGLDLILLLAAFQEFFAENSEAWLSRFDYREAGPHLMLMAFLQRIVNGGGRIGREFAVGSGRADLVVQFGGQRAVIELKVRRGEETVRAGIAQLCAYLERLGETEGYLVVFDRRKGVPWADKIFIQEVAGPAGQRVHVFGA